jgi:hypothetical protein
MSASSKAVWASLGALALCLMAAIGAPPSEFVQEPTIWTRLEPAMLPMLFAGPCLAVLALVLTFFAPGAAAITCIAAATASMLGVLFGWGVDAEVGLKALLLPIALLTMPVLGAAGAIRQGRRERITRGGAPLGQRAG